MIYLQFLKRSFSQFTEQKTLKLLLKTVLITFFLLLLINVSIYCFLDWAGFYQYLIHSLFVPVILGKVVVFIILHMISMLLFPALLIGISGVFLEDIADLVEEKYYSYLPKANKISTFQQLKSLLSLIGLILFVNLLMIPIYFFPVINIIIFYLLNGYLISKEYFELISLRRISVENYRKLWKKKFFSIYVGGIICSIGISVPILNLFVPYLSTAFMVHLFDNYTQYDSKLKKIEII